MSKNRSLDAAEMKHPNKIGLRDSFGYAFGDAANLFVLTYVSSYLKVFYTDILKVAENKITTLLLIARLWDAINDPLWGNIVAKKKPNKDGKFRPYLKWVAVPLGISTVLCFLPLPMWGGPTNKVFLFIFALVTYTAYGMMYTGMNIPFGSLASVITDDPKGRTLLSTFRSIGSGVGGAVVSLLAPMLCFNKYTVDNVEVVETDGNKMFFFGLAMGILSIVFYLWGYKSTKERVPSEAEPKVDFKATYLGLFKSRPFVTVALAGVLISGQLQFNSFNSYLYKIYFTDSDLGTIGTICNYLPMVIFVLITPKLVEKFGKKELCGNFSVIAAFASVALAVVANNQKILDFLFPKTGLLPAWLFMVTLLLIGFGYTFVSLTCWAVVMDVIDYQELKTGIRNESAVYAVYTFSRKLGQTIADGAGLFLLSWAGYSGDMNSFVPGTSQKILFICTVIPAIVYTGVWLLMKFGYPLDKKRLEPIYAEIRRRREADMLSQQPPEAM